MKSLSHVNIQRLCHRRAVLRTLHMMQLYIIINKLATLKHKDNPILSYPDYYLIKKGKNKCFFKIKKIIN